MIDFDENTDCSQCKQKCIAQFIDRKDIALLSENKTEVYYSAGQVITKQSSFCSKIIFISSGLVKFTKEGRHGKNTIVKIEGADGFISIPIADNQKRFAYTAVALTDVKICEINEQIIHHSLINNIRLKAFLLQNYYKDLMFMVNRLHLMNTRNNHGKLASSLLYLNTFCSEGFSVFEFITRKDLAELSFISLESVNKIVQELKNDRIIDINKKGIQLDKIGLIEKLSNIG
jgi:CRP-like cAMP-binding protein